MNNKYVRYLYVCFYIGLMVLSTWATVESFHMLLPDIPVFALWLLSIILFYIASIGTKLIITSFDYSIRVNGRAKFLIGGIVLLLLFWIGLILPTNTHTFFYNSVIKQTTLEELKNTETSLSNILIQGNETILKEKAAFESKIRQEISNYSSEILNAGQPGAGVRAQTILQRIQSELGDVKINPLTLRSQKQGDLIEYQRQMAKQIEEKMKIVSEERYNTRLNNLKSNIDKNEINTLIKKIGEEVVFIKKSEKPRNETKNILIESFTLVNKYSDRLKSNNSSATSLIDASGTPKIKELENVIQVWRNFFNGKYKGLGFIFWILLAVLIDVGGFIFFYLAFKKEY